MYTLIITYTNGSLCIYKQTYKRYGCAIRIADKLTQRNDVAAVTLYRGKNRA